MTQNEQFYAICCRPDDVFYGEDITLVKVIATAREATASSSGKNYFVTVATEAAAGIAKTNSRFG